MQTQGLYAGTSFAALDGKGRVAIPATLRNSVPTVHDADKGRDERVLWVTAHESLPCLVAYGDDHFAAIPAEIERQEELAVARGEPFDKDAAFKKRFGFAESYTLDGSGRFIPSAMHRTLGELSGLICFHGAGRRFEIWSVDALLSDETVDPILRRLASAAAKAAGTAGAK